MLHPLGGTSPDRPHHDPVEAPSNRIGRVGGSGGSADTASVFFGRSPNATDVDLAPGDNIDNFRYPSLVGPRVKPPLDPGIGTAPIGSPEVAARHAVSGQNAVVPFTKLHGVDGFVVVDLDGAQRSSGVVRCARKVLRDSAAGLARHRTYAYAVMAVEASGASAGVNAEPDGRDAALAAFGEEVASLGVMFDPGKGVTAAHLAALSTHDTRDRTALGLAPLLEAIGIVAAIEAIRPLDGLDVVIESGDHALLDELFATGGAAVRHVEPGRVDEPCDALVVGSRPGVIDHENAAAVVAAVVVPAAPLPVSTRGLAALRRQGITVLPDFVTLSGALLSHWPDRGVDADALHSAVTGRVTQVIADALGHPDGPVIGAAEQAEAFLATWCDQLPFGRPI